ncbi:MAG: ABC transporter ATP-binding protein [Methanoregula sp.]|nr:ABC transporter ATP-binding protein [Methanoregula sp.]
MIDVSGLVKIFLEGGREIRPLDGIDFTCERGEFILIVGRSGSGKTTFLNILGGLTQPSSGRVKIDGNEIGKLSDAECSALRFRTIGFVFQFPGLLAPLTALENVTLSSSITGVTPEDPAYARTLLERVGLPGKADTLPAHLSGGELKRVAIARALVNRPSLILADEPTADLDIETEREVMALFREINRSGTTIVMVTHNTELAPFASRVMKMENGNLTEYER